VTIEKFNKVMIASMVLIPTIFLCMVWYFIPEDWTYSFPFFDNTTWKPSLNPETYRTYKVKVLTQPFIDQWIAIPYVLAALIGGWMKLPIRIKFNVRGFKIDRIKFNFKGFKFDKTFIYELWFGYGLWVVIQTTDYLLTFRQTPFRVYGVIVLLIINIIYLDWAKRNLTF